MTGLEVFEGEADCPVLVTRQPVMDERDDTGNVFTRGYVCTTAKGKAYIEAKSRCQDFHEDSASHSLPLYLISRLLDGEVEWIYIAEGDTGFMYEYPAEVFDPESGKCLDVSTGNDWREIGVPVGVAEKWDRSEVSLSL